MIPIELLSKKTLLMNDLQVEKDLNLLIRMSHLFEKQILIQTLQSAQEKTIVLFPIWKIHRRNK